MAVLQGHYDLMVTNLSFYTTGKSARKFHPGRIEIRPEVPSGTD